VKLLFLFFCLRNKEEKAKILNEKRIEKSKKEQAIKIRTTYIIFSV